MPLQDARTRMRAVDVIAIADEEAGLRLGAFYRHSDAV